MSQHNNCEIVPFYKSSNFAHSVAPINDIKQVKELAANNNLCLLYAEIDPINYHRVILVERTLNDNRFAITHITAKRNEEIVYQTHSELEKQLLDLYKKQTDSLQEAYILHNQKISYKLKINCVIPVSSSVKSMIHLCVR